MSDPVPAMVEREDAGKMFKNVVVRSKGRSREDGAKDRVWSIVEWITGNQCS